MKLSNFDYTYPEELVAQKPLSQRDASKMMVLKPAHRTFEHSSIKNITDHLKEGDVLVVNDSKVLPVRLYGKRESGGEIEALLLRNIDTENNIWLLLTNRKKRIKIDDKIIFSDDLYAKVMEKRDDGIVAKLFFERELGSILDEIGLPPLPPYIKRESLNDYTKEDRERYQNVFAKTPGSAAAPTAGFHLSKKILKTCNDKGVKVVTVTLHVGIDTFTPVRVDNLSDHKMHGEYFTIPTETADEINRAINDKRRVIAIGTTTVRALESAAKISTQNLPLEPMELVKTDLFISPGYKFNIINGMLTNFHQPKSTLIVMVSAFAGREFVLQMYDEAIKKRYRLFSYGDCMLII